MKLIIKIIRVVKDLYNMLESIEDTFSCGKITLVQY